jgi:hypothetical protein
MAMHVVSQDDLISIAQFDLDQNQNISSPQTDCSSLLSLCPCIKHGGDPVPTCAPSDRAEQHNQPIMEHDPLAPKPT